MVRIECFSPDITNSSVHSASQTALLMCIARFTIVSNILNTTLELCRPILRALSGPTSSPPALLFYRPIASPDILDALAFNLVHS